MSLHIQHRGCSFRDGYLPPSESSGLLFQTGVPRRLGGGDLSPPQREGSSDSPKAWALLVGSGRAGRVELALGVSPSFSREGHRSLLDRPLTYNKSLGTAAC